MDFKLNRYRRYLLEELNDSDSEIDPSSTESRQKPLGVGITQGPEDTRQCDNVDDVNIPPNLHSTVSPKFPPNPTQLNLSNSDSESLSTITNRLLSSASEY